MKSQCCGEKLPMKIPHAEGYAAGEHQWQCKICGTVYKQKIRLGKDRDRNVWGTIRNLT